MPSCCDRVDRLRASAHLRWSKGKRLAKKQGLGKPKSSSYNSRFKKNMFLQLRTLLFHAECRAGKQIQHRGSTVFMNYTCRFLTHALELIGSSPYNINVKWRLWRGLFSVKSSLPPRIWGVSTTHQMAKLRNESGFQHMNHSNIITTEDDPHARIVLVQVANEALSWFSRNSNFEDTYWWSHLFSKRNYLLLSI